MPVGACLYTLFYRKERRGQAQAPIEKRGGVKTGSNPAEPVPTGFL